MVAAANALCVQFNIIVLQITFWRMSMESVLCSLGDIVANAYRRAVVAEMVLLSIGFRRKANHLR